MAAVVVFAVPSQRFRALPAGGDAGGGAAVRAEKHWQRLPRWVFVATLVACARCSRCWLSWRVVSSMKWAGLYAGAIGC